MSRVVGWRVIDNSPSSVTSQVPFPAFAVRVVPSFRTPPPRRSKANASHGLLHQSPRLHCCAGSRLTLPLSRRTYSRRIVRLQKEIEEGALPRTPPAWPPDRTSCMHLRWTPTLLLPANIPIRQLPLPPLPQTRPRLDRQPTSLARSGNVPAIPLRSEQAHHATETTEGMEDPIPREL